MIKNPLLAEKYARAFYEATKGKADIADFLRRVEGLPEDFLSRPALPYPMLVKALGGEPATKELRNLLKLLCRRKRHFLLPELLSAYQTKVERAAGLFRANVTAPVAIDSAAQAKLEALVARISGARSVKLDVEIDPAILSGFIVRAGDNLIDASGKSRLEEFRSKF